MLWWWWRMKTLRRMIWRLAATGSALIAGILELAVQPETIVALVFG
jgi:hypothetical protein